MQHFQSPTTQARSLSRVSRAALRLGFLLLSLLLIGAADAAELPMELIDHASGNGMASVRIIAEELLSDGSREWRAAFETDSEGIARFDLAGLGEGRRYVLKAKPFAHWVESEEVSEAGWFAWRVGRLAVQVVHGMTGEPLAGEPVWLREQAADGSFPAVMQATTDASGWVRLDPPELGEVPLVLRARSPSDGAYKYTAAIHGPGARRLDLGNEPLVARVVDGVSGQGLSDVVVEAYERVESGDLLYRARRRTDTGGRAAFDLDGLGHGRMYVLRAEPFGHRVESGDLGLPGEHVVRAGTMQVELRSGASGNPYRRQQVALFEVLADGTREHVQTLESDGEGVVYLEPAGLGERRYQLRASSPVDGRGKFSEVYDTSGRYIFTVGGPALTVKLREHTSGDGVVGVRIIAEELLSDGSREWRAAFETDSEGIARFDLAGLGEGRRYVLKAKPFAHWVESEEVSEAGWFAWRVGRLAVQVVHGMTGEPLAGEPVWLREQAADGSFPAVMQATTDASGWVRLDPPELGEVPLVLRARSPSDGAYKYTAAIHGPGARRLDLGNEPLVARVVDGVSGQGLSDVVVEAYERVESGDLLYRARRRTDTGGRAAFDLDGLGHGRMYVLRAEPFGHRVESGDLGLPGEHVVRAGTMQVELRSGASGNPYRRQQVALFEVLADGTREHVQTLESDGEGVVYLEPAGLGERRYQLRASSPVDGRGKFSEVYDTSGRYIFTVGGPALTVKLREHTSGDGVVGVRIIAEELLSDGSREWRAAFETDSEGIARFDLAGLGEGRRYVLKAKPFAHWVESEEVSEAGWFAWRVGRLAVQVVHGMTGEPLAGEPVWLREQAADGSFPAVMQATTDASGWVRLDPPELGEVPLVLRARSPSDGAYKYTAAIHGPGARRLDLGNEPLVARVVDGVSGQGLSDVVVEAYERVESGDLLYRARRRTDTGGRAAFDLDGLGHGRMYVLRAEPFGHRVESGDLGLPGEHVVRAGTMQVELRSGASGNPYRRQQVALFEVLADGTREHVQTLESDGEGVVYLEPAGLGERRYQLRASSPVDGRGKFSEVYDTSGRYIFTVGGPALTVKLREHTSGDGVVGVRIIAEELLSDGSREWRAAFETDSEGIARFDLAGLGEGRRYVLKAKPFAHWVESEEVSEAGWFAWRVGTLPVTVRDAAGEPVPHAAVIIFEKSSSGALIAVMEAVADENGQVRLDPAGLGTGQTYVIKVVDPLGRGEDYFSDFVRYRGEVRIAVVPGVTNAPDLVPPQVAIDGAFNGARFGDHGFLVTGTFDDNVHVRSITVRMHSADGIIMEVPATLRRGVGRWEAEIPAVSTTVPATVVLKVVAVDRADNLSEAATRIQLVHDNAGPVIEVSSHDDQDKVPDGAFVVHGNAYDDIGSVVLTARLRNDAGEVVDERPVEVAISSGRWSYTAFASEAMPSAQILFEIAAKDEAGNETLEVLHLIPSVETRLQRRALERLTFGPTPTLTDEIAHIGLEAFIEQQLNPQAVDDSIFVAQRTQPADPAQRTIEAALYSRRQLLEVLTVFWANHFNTDLSAHGVTEYENDEHDMFRQHALGRFRDLLGASAKSRAMLRYLDGYSSVAEHPNENYARELLELHTLGDTSNFSENDVVEIARAFTGWTVVNDAFVFVAQRHDFDAKQVLGRVLPAGQGIGDGEHVLDILALAPGTAANVCKKLIGFFVGRESIQKSLGPCADRFLAFSDQPNQLGKLVEWILKSQDFDHALRFGSTTRTPLEYVAAAVRALEADVSLDWTARELFRLGMPLHENPTPTGYSNFGADWATSGALLRRLRFVKALVMGHDGFGNVFGDISDRARVAGIETVDGICGYLLSIPYGSSFSRKEWLAVRDELTNSGKWPFTLQEQHAERRLRKALLVAFALPQYHLK